MDNTMMDSTMAEVIERQRPAAPRPWWVLPALSCALAVVALLAYGLVVSSRAQPAAGPAPDFTLQTFEDETIRLSDFRGTPVVINFWASWCLECKVEAPLLEATWRKYQGEVLFIGVDYVDTEPAALAYLEEFDITYPNGPDLGTKISDMYRIKGVPETFFIDRAGNLQGVKIGPLGEAELEGWIARISSQ
ncbi:MAG: TlpA family protein disulfide reductase [Ardenticatenaceae bacterium]